MNTKEIEDIVEKDLYEVNGGENRDSTNINKALKEIYTQIKNFFTS